MLSRPGSGKLGIYCSRIPGAMDPSLHVTRRRRATRTSSPWPHGPRAHGLHRPHRTPSPWPAPAPGYPGHTVPGSIHNPSIPKPGDLAGSPVDPWGPCGRCGRCDVLTGGAGRAGAGFPGAGGKISVSKNICMASPHFFEKFKP